MVKELAPDEFTERLLPIFTDVEKRLPDYPGKSNPEHFFPTWRNLMNLKVARTWEQGPGDAVLGAIFTPNIFFKDRNALVSFWFKRNGAPSALPLMHAAINAAREDGCVHISSSAYHGLGEEVMEKVYERLGFEPLETVFRKVL